MNAGNKNTPSAHQPRRRNVTTLVVGLKNGHIRKKSHPKVVNPRDIAGERKKKKKKDRSAWCTKGNSAEFASSENCAGIFLGSSHTSDFKIGTPVATLPGAWLYRVSAGTGRPGVSILWLGEVESLICSFYLSVAARKLVWADPSLRYTSLFLGR